MSHPIDYEKVVPNLNVETPIKQIVNGARGNYSLHLHEMRTVPFESFATNALVAGAAVEALTVEERETKFWKSLGLGNSFHGSFQDPTYGADIPGTLRSSNYSFKYTADLNA